MPTDRWHDQDRPTMDPILPSVKREPTAVQYNRCLKQTSFTAEPSPTVATEPHRACRRLFGLSHATIAGSSAASDRGRAGKIRYGPVSERRTGVCGSVESRRTRQTFAFSPSRPRRRPRHAGLSARRDRRGVPGRRARRSGRRRRERLERRPVPVRGGRRSRAVRWFSAKMCTSPCFRKSRGRQVGPDLPEVHVHQLHERIPGATPINDHGL